MVVVTAIELAGLVSTTAGFCDAAPPAHALLPPRAAATLAHPLLDGLAFSCRADAAALASSFCISAIVLRVVALFTAAPPHAGVAAAGTGAGAGAASVAAG